MSSVLETAAPERLGSRDQARAMFGEHRDRLRGASVLLDCSRLQASTSSFVDELILDVLVEAGATRLILRNAPERTTRFARRSALLRGVEDRLVID